ncbi:MAG: hypothetical protein HQ568_04200, partial [Calditrichaeota bacterium]|nr:hypothetical protein [Calditrichota bacterium]
SGTGVITSYAASYQAYTDDEYRSLLTNTGFSNIRKYSSLTGDDNNTMEGLVVFTAEK